MNHAKLFLLPMLLFAGAAQAHVSVSPILSTPGKTETYTFSVPTEGTSATTSVDVEIPEQMTVLSVNGPPSGYTITRSGDRITKVTWHVNIAAGQGQDLSLVARNPTTRQFGVEWKVHQRYANGSRSAWTDPMPSRPAPTTRILP